MYRSKGRLLVVGGAVALVVVLLAVAAYTMGRSSSAGAPPAGSPPTPETTGICEFVEHSAGGAATTAANGLYQLALANLGEQDPAAVEKILTRYVEADQRARMRTYLATARSTLTAVVDMPVGYQAVAYDPAVALIRLLVVDAGVTADGTPKTAAGVIDVTLHWDATQGFWRMASWPGNDNPATLTDLLRDMEPFCHAAV
jgi:hypothetical protein